MALQKPLLTSHTLPSILSFQNFSKNPIATTPICFIFINSLYSTFPNMMARTSNFFSIFCLAILFLTAHAVAVPFGTSLDTFPQLQAQAACLALDNSQIGWRSAIPRKCSGHATCATICNSLQLHAPDKQRQNAKNHVCLDSFHLYNQGFSKKEHMAGLKTYRYNSCNRSGCGPNFCCCLSY